MMVRPLTRNDFLNVFKPCQLHTRYRFLHLVPHSMCVWGASHAHRIGYHILVLQHDGRWTKASTALESYTRRNLVAMQPEKVMRDKLKYIQMWTFARLAFIARNAIQLPRGGRPHPYQGDARILSKLLQSLSHDPAQEVSKSQDVEQASDVVSQQKEWSVHQKGSGVNTQGA